MPSLSLELKNQFGQPNSLARQPQVLLIRKRHQPTKIENKIKEAL